MPANTIDDDLTDESRWSSFGDGKWIAFDLAIAKDVREIHSAWYKGDTRTSFYDIESSLDAVSWSTLQTNVQSQGTTSLEAVTLDSTDARYIRVVGRGNTDNTWNSLIEVDIYDCGETGTPTEDPVVVEPPEPPEPPAPTDGDMPATTPNPPLVTDALDPDAAPSSNFDLWPWYLSVPTDTDGSGTADSIKESDLNAGYESSEFFYTAADGGMVFKCPVAGFKTSTNTSYTRVELREMLRRGNSSISTQGVNSNNWVFGSAPQSDLNAAGGIDGNLRATLAVNKVTTTHGDGFEYQVGRVIIGQIHANDDEPIRLYYRKLPSNSKGSIYFAHELLDGDDTWHEMIGSRGDNASDPADGIALDEKFSYEIDVRGNTLTVTIMREGKPDVTKVLDMSASGYDEGGQYMYFKAGVYNQNNSGDPDDYVQATFYALEATHN